MRRARSRRAIGGFSHLRRPDATLAEAWSTACDLTRPVHCYTARSPSRRLAGKREVRTHCVNANTPARLLTQNAAEGGVLCLVNEERAAKLVPPLTLNLRLQAAARQHANDARTIKWWAGGGSKIHVNPVTGSTPQDRIKGAGYCPEEPECPMNENGYSA
jgi:uncharacterized protein YkwD